MCTHYNYLFLEEKPGSDAFLCQVIMMIKDWHFSFFNLISTATPDYSYTQALWQPTHRGVSLLGSGGHKHLYNNITVKSSLTSPGVATRADLHAASSRTARTCRRRGWNCERSRIKTKEFLWPCETSVIRTFDELLFTFYRGGNLGGASLRPWTRSNPGLPECAVRPGYRPDSQLEFTAAGTCPLTRKSSLCDWILNFLLVVDAL